MSTTSTRSKALAIIMALCLVFSYMLTATPKAYAATANTAGQIVMNSNESGRVYKAYNIFKSDTSTDSSGVVTHSTVEWGGGIDSANFIRDLYNAVKTDTTSPLYNNSALAGIKYDDTALDDSTKTTDAAALAAMLKEISSDGTTNKKDRTPALKAIASIAAANKATGVQLDENYTYALDADADPAYYKQADESFSTTVTDDGPYARSTANYGKDGLQTGYWLVVDESTAAADGSFVSDNILVDVGELNPAAIYPKGDKPKSGKDEQENSCEVGELGDGSNDYQKVGDYTIGDTISFRLWGTLPFDYADYASYKYEFSDTMGQGLKIDPASVRVYIATLHTDGKPNFEDVRRAVKNQEGTQATLVPDTAYALVTDPNPPTGAGETTMTITFANLKADSMPDAIKNIDPNNAAFVVLYNAQLTADATPGVGIENKSKVTYTSKKDGTGEKETPEEKTTTFTWELDNTKVDSSKTTYTFTEADIEPLAEGTPLPEGIWVKAKDDATDFREDSNGVKYTRQLDQAISATGPYYTCSEGAPKTLANAKFVLVREIRVDANTMKHQAALLDGNNKVVSWADIDESAKKYTAMSDSEKDAALKKLYAPESGPASATEFASNANGVFNILGLDSNYETGNFAAPIKYYLHETAAPTGYNKLTEDVALTIKATYNDALTEITKIELTTNKTNMTPNGQQPGENGAFDPLAERIDNTPGNTLPETGGMGTLIFTIVGIALMLTAAVVYVVRRRNQS